MSTSSQATSHNFEPKYGPIEFRSGALERFLLDENDNLQAASKILRSEMQFYDRLDFMYQSFLYNSPKLKKGETKFFAFAEIVRGQILRSLSNVMRHHLTDALAVSRTAAEAAFYAKMLAESRLTEEQYFNDSRLRNGLLRQVKKQLEKKELVDPTVRDLRDVVSAHSRNGSHADPSIFAFRIREDGSGSVGVPFFQAPAKADIQHYFLGMLWVGNLCLKAFIEIARDHFEHESTATLAEVHAFNDLIRSYRTEKNIGPQPAAGAFS